MVTHICLATRGFEFGSCLVASLSIWAWIIIAQVGLLSFCLKKKKKKESNYLRLKKKRFRIQGAKGKRQIFTFLKILSKKIFCQNLNFPVIFYLISSIDWLETWNADFVV